MIHLVKNDRDLFLPELRLRGLRHQSIEELAPRMFSFNNPYRRLPRPVPDWAIS